MIKEVQAKYILLEPLLNNITPNHKNTPSLFYTPLKYPRSFKFSSSICTNQAPVFQQTCLYFRRNQATVSMLSVTGRPRGYAECA